MSQLTIFGDTASATSSPAEASGRSSCATLDSPTTGRPGPEAAPAPRSPSQAKAQGLTTLVTSGRTGYASSASVALEDSLVSRLMQRCDTAGSTLFVQTWKRRATPLRRRFWEHTASARPTGDSAFTSVPTPDTGANLTDGSWEDRRQRAQAKHGNNGFGLNLQQAASLVAVPTPRSSEAGPDYAIVNRENSGGLSLQTTAALATVATPRSEDSQCAGAHRGTADTLHAQANLASVTMPSARDYKDTAGMSASGVDPDGSIRSRLDQLPRQAQLAASGPDATGGTGATAGTGQLNPEYSLWLMGIPRVWASFAWQATQSLSRRRKRSSAAIAKREV